MDLRKNVSVFQEGGSTPAPPTPPEIRVVLLHTERFLQSFNEPTLCSMLRKNMIFRSKKNVSHDLKIVSSICNYSDTI